MRVKYLVWVFTAILAVSLSACDLPEVTPPVAEANPSATPAIKVPPLASPTIDLVSPSLIKITSQDVLKLSLAHKAAASNVQNITWTRDGTSLSVISQNSDANGNQIYGVTTLDSSDLSPLSVYTSTGDRISAVAADGRTVAVISQDLKSYKLVDMGSSNTDILNQTPGYLVGNISFSPDLRYFAVTKMESWEVILIDLVTSQDVKSLSGFETAAPVFNAVFDESLQWIVWFSRGTIQLQDVETGTLKDKINHEDFITSFALSSDGALLATSASGTIAGSYQPAIYLWDTTTSAETKTILPIAMANAISFSPDGSLLAVAAGKDLQLWDVTSGVLLTTLTGHSDVITQVAFSPDQKTIATTGIDNQLYLWQINE